jgi:two-component system sensor histidine kinase KdpD
MIFLLTVVLTSTRLGLKPSILSAFLSVLAFDFFFVPPRFTFRVSDSQYLLTFAALFTVGVVISTLVSRVRERAEAIRVREVQTSSLYHLSRDLAATYGIQAILDVIIKNIRDSLDACVIILLAEGEHLEVKASSDHMQLDTKEHAVADWAFRNQKPAGRGTETLISARLLYLPLQTTTGVLGVLGVKLADEEGYAAPEPRRLLQAFAAQATLAIERVQLVRQAEQAQLLQAREGLERALLNSISHDLRTPLVSITGALDTLRDNVNILASESRKKLLDTALEEAERLNRFVGNLLDMTRLEAGALKVRKEPCDVQDLAGCALAALDKRIGTRTIDITIPPDLPAVRMDLALMTQVLVNIIDNSLKYAPDAGSIELTAHAVGGGLVLEVADHGPGVPEADLNRVFDKFYRIPVPEGAGGTGLGLSICKGIVEAHGGGIKAKNRAGGGLSVTISLPL